MSCVRVGIFVGSTRPNCNGQPLATWLHRLLRSQASLWNEYTLLDISNWKLPLLDEPGIPAKDQPVNAHTKPGKKKSGLSVAFCS